MGKPEPQFNEVDRSPAAIAEMENLRQRIAQIDKKIAALSRERAAVNKLFFSECNPSRESNK
jgi:cell division protein FtsB